MYLLSLIPTWSMKQASKYFGVVAIFAIFALATMSVSIVEADAALKAKGEGVVPPKSYGHKNNHKVCGDKLCSSGGNPDPRNIGKVN